MSPGRLALTAACLAAVLALLASGCGGSDSSSGEVALTWEKPASKTDQNGYEILKAGETPVLVKTVEKTFALPDQLTVEGVNGNDGPAYDPEDHSVIFPYEFAAMTHEAVREATTSASEQEVAERTKDIDEMILAHTLGHALIDQFGLKASGSEEDLADEIGTILFLRTSAGASNGTDASIFFADFSNRPEPVALVDYVKAHGLDLPHATEILCWVAGSSKRALQEVVETGVLGGADTCPQEFEQVSGRVGRALDAHLETGASLTPVP